MRRILRRPLLWLLPVIVIPLGALIWVQYSFLRTLERTSASADRNWMRSALEEASVGVDSYYRKAADEALTMDASMLCNCEVLGEHFKKYRVAGAQTFFTMKYNGEHARGTYFDPWGRPKTLTDAELQAVKLASVTWHVAHKFNRVIASPALSVDERDTRYRTIMKPVVDGSMRVVGVAGVVLEEQAAKAAVLQIGRQKLKKYSSDNNLTLQVAQKFQGAGFMTTSLPFAFTSLRLGIRAHCTPEEMAAWEFRNNMMLAGGMTVVIFGAVILALQAAFRQMRLSQMKSDFVSNVSHELRTPLASIRVFGEYMRLGRVEKHEKIREYGEYIEAESRRLTQLINNILDFSKIESAEKKYKFAETDVVSLVGQTVSAIGMPLREHGYAISFSGPGRPLPPLTIDKDAIGQVVANLLDNAVKYSNGRKEIEVEVGADHSHVRIAVRDHGIGIEACEQKKIFEKFYRVGSGLVHDVKGSGLGLAIVSHVVKAHGGRVEVVSRPGEGSTFTIFLPSVEAPALGRLTDTNTEFA